MNIKHIFILQLCFVLLGCSGEEGDDLDQFMRDAVKDMHPRIEPLPEVKPYIPLQYNADGSLNDPFQARKAKASASGNLQPDLNRPKEALEAYPLESLKFVGILEKAKLKFGLIQLPDKSVQQVKLGNYIGQNYGIVTEIGETGIKIKEIIQDEITGDWIERPSSIDLQE